MQVSELTGRVIVTGADRGYFHLLEDLIRSIRLFRSAEEQPIVVIDGGLPGPYRQRLLTAYGVNLLDVPWEYPLSSNRTQGRQYLKLQISRAFLDRYLPNAELIAWLDADTWIQDIAGLDLLFESAADGKLAIVSETSRYSRQVMGVEWAFFGYAKVKSLLYKNARKAGVPEADARRIGLRPTLNSGVFALRQDAPHWEAWRRRQRQVIPKARIFTSDQLSLGMAVYLDNLPLELLPETCNYMGPWKASSDGLRLVEFYAPYRPVSIVHLAGRKDLKAEPEASTAIPLVGGGVFLSPLRQIAWESACVAVAQGHQLTYRHRPRTSESP